MRTAPERAGGDDSIIVALGGNVAPPGESVAEGLERALLAFPSVGLEVVRRSRLWRSAAWPDPADPPFLNAVAIVETALGPEGVLEALHRLEATFGRVRGEANAPRTLDLDLIAYGRMVREDTPVLPHPRAAERRFVMGPLAEVLPTWCHPVGMEGARELAVRAMVGCDAAPMAAVYGGGSKCTLKSPPVAPGISN